MNLICMNDFWAVDAGVNVESFAINLKLFILKWCDWKFLDLWQFSVETWSEAFQTTKLSTNHRAFSQSLRFFVSMFENTQLLSSSFSTSLRF